MKKKKIFSNEAVSEIIEMYKNKTFTKEISKKFRVRQAQISQILKDNNVKFYTSKDERLVEYSLNHRYFEKIDTPAKAYTLGYFFADGFTSSVNNTVGIIINDIDALEFFKKEFECNKPFIKNKHHENATTFTFASSKMKEDLRRLGCVPVKSLILEYPKIHPDFLPEELEKYFILGYFDGDGSLWISKTTKHYCLKIISSTKFCQSLCDRMLEKGLNAKMCWEPRYKKETSYVCMYRKKDIVKFLEESYDTCPFFLKRKYEKFLKIKQQCVQNIASKIQ